MQVSQPKKHLLSELWKTNEGRREGIMNDVAVKILIFLIGSLCGGGFGFVLACFGATGIVKERNRLEDELKKVKAERDELKKNPPVKNVEIHDSTIGKTVDFGGF